MKRFINYLCWHQQGNGGYNCWIRMLEVSQWLLLFYMYSKVFLILGSNRCQCKVCNTFLNISLFMKLGWTWNFAKFTQVILLYICICFPAVLTTKSAEISENTCGKYRVKIMKILKCFIPMSFLRRIISSGTGPIISNLSEVYFNCCCPCKRHFLEIRFA